LDNTTKEEEVNLPSSEAEANYLTLQQRREKGEEQEPCSLSASALSKRVCMHV
jgi:hypothetical protein